MSIHRVSQLTSQSTFSFTLYISSVVLSGHYAMVRFEQQENDVPEDASRYWAKRIVPPFLFGSKHASTFLKALVLRLHLKLTTQTDSLIFLINSFHISIFLVLFQMALIPFTMSRYTIASLSNSKLNDYLPLNKSMSIHIYLGYTMVCFSIIATVIVSFFFFCCVDWQRCICMRSTYNVYFYHSHLICNIHSLLFFNIHPHLVLRIPWCIVF